MEHCGVLEKCVEGLRSVSDFRAPVTRIAYLTEEVDLQTTEMQCTAPCGRSM